jgi:hypothetical protein
VSGLVPMTKSKENADELLEVLDDEELDVDDVDDVEVVVEVEEDDDVVDGVEELSVEEVLVGVVVELLTRDEGTSTRYAPTAATAMTTTTSPAIAAVPTATRHLSWVNCIPKSPSTRHFICDI